MVVVLTMALVTLASPDPGLYLILVVAAIVMVLDVPECPRLFGFGFSGLDLPGTPMVGP